MSNLFKKSRWLKVVGSMMALIMALSFVGFGAVADANALPAATTQVQIQLDGTPVGTMTTTDIAALNSHVFRVYSTQNSFGTVKFYGALGATVVDIVDETVEDAALTPVNWGNIQEVRIYSGAAFATFTKAEVIGMLNCFPNAPSGSATGAIDVPLTISTMSQDWGSTYPTTAPTVQAAEDMRSMIGQTQLGDVNNPRFVKNVTAINVIQ